MSEELRHAMPQKCVIGCAIFSTGLCSIVFLLQYLNYGEFTKGQLISKCLYEVIVWTKIPTKNLIISALKGPGQKLSKKMLVFWSKR